MDIAGKLQKVGVVFNQHALEPTLEQMPAATMPVVESSRIGSGKPLHGPGEIRPAGPEQQMVMVGHQHIGKKLNLKPLGKLTDGIQKQAAILLAEENIPALIAARQYMVVRSLEFDSPRPSHADNLSRLWCSVKP
jgi:hypothetical protein